MQNELERILIDPSFLYLRQWEKRRHLFDIINANEMTHSAMIGWLLNPNESHEQGSFFIKNLFYKLSIEGEFALTLQQVESISYENLLIELEVTAAEGRIDILMFDPVNRLLFIIENKFGAGLTNNQLDRYKSWAQSKVVSSGEPSIQPVYILLDAFDSIAEDKRPTEWHVTDYSWLEESIKAVLNRSMLSAENERLLRDYYIALPGGDYTVDPQLKDYQKHLALLAEKYPNFVSSLQDTSVTAMNLDIKGHLYSKNVGHAQAATYQRYKTIFTHLVDYSRYDWIEHEIEKSQRNCYEFDYFKRGLSIYPKAWEFLRLKSDNYWPVYITIEENSSEAGGYTLTLTLRKNYLKKGHEGKLDAIAKYHNTTIKGATRNIKLHRFDAWNKHGILEMTKEHISLLASFANKA